MWTFLSLLKHRLLIFSTIHQPRFYISSIISSLFELFLCTPSLFYAAWFRIHYFCWEFLRNCAEALCISLWYWRTLIIIRKLLSSTNDFLVLQSSVALFFLRVFDFWFFHSRFQNWTALPATLFWFTRFHTLHCWFHGRHSIDW